MSFLPSNIVQPCTDRGTGFQHWLVTSAYVNNVAMPMISCKKSILLLEPCVVCMVMYKLPFTDNIYINGGRSAHDSTCLRSFERMCLSVATFRVSISKPQIVTIISSQDIIIQTNNIRFAKDQVEVFQGFSRPKTFHPVSFRRFRKGYIIESSVSDVCSCMFFNSLKHLPRFVLQRCVTCNSIENEH